MSSVVSAQISSAPMHKHHAVLLPKLISLQKTTEVCLHNAK